MMNTHIKFILKKFFISIYHLRTLLYIFICILNKKINSDKSITGNLWLIGENYGNCLQDNGYHFFNYCQTQKNKEEIFFVTNKKSLQQIQSSGNSTYNIVIYGTYKHTEILLYSKALLFSHSPRDLLYPLIQPFIFKKQCIVFLQHGVFGLKKSNRDQKFFLKYLDIFIVSSEWEKNIIKSNFNINEEKIEITGLARYDTLIDKTSSDKKLLYIPTWRDGINQQQIFPEYTKQIISFLNSRELENCLNKYNVTLKVYFHKNMYYHCSKIKEKLTNKAITIVNIGEQSVQSLIQESNIMITDYSSVSWDFSFLKKPIIFYQFDRDEYLQNRGSYINLTNIPTGYSTVSQDDVIIKLKQLLENNNATSNINPLEFFEFNDQNNSLRIYKLITSKKHHKAFLN